MDKKQAQFILHSFRPDGADAADADFAEALQLAVEDRDLGEWLADERAADAEFAAALCEVEIPDELRMHILSVMRGEKPTDPALEAEMDDLLSDALAHVEPPSGLRDQILAAMQVEQSQRESQPDQLAEALPDNVSEMPPAHPASGSNEKSTTSSSNRWLRRFSLAAAIALGVIFAFQIELGSKNTQSGAQPKNKVSTRISSHDVQQVAGQMLNSKFALDVVNPAKKEVNTWLVSHELPAPARLPDGLRGLKVMGCKKIQLSGGMTASLLCFTKDSGGMVHLVIIKNKYINDVNLPSMNEMTKGDCYHCPKTNWNVIRWRDRENTYVLLGKKTANDNEDLIQYF